MYYNKIRVFLRLEHFSFCVSQKKKVTWVWNGVIKYWKDFHFGVNNSYKCHPGAYISLFWVLFIYILTFSYCYRLFHRLFRCQAQMCRLYVQITCIYLSFALGLDITAGKTLWCEIEGEKCVSRVTVFQLFSHISAWNTEIHWDAYVCNVNFNPLPQPTQIYIHSQHLHFQPLQVMIYSPYYKFVQTLNQT